MLLDLLNKKYGMPLLKSSPLKQLERSFRIRNRVMSATIQQ